MFASVLFVCFPPHLIILSSPSSLFFGWLQFHPQFFPFAYEVNSLFLSDVSQKKQLDTSSLSATFLRLAKFFLMSFETALPSCSPGVQCLFHKPFTCFQRQNFARSFAPRNFLYTCLSPSFAFPNASLTSFGLDVHPIIKSKAENQWHRIEK